MSNSETKKNASKKLTVAQMCYVGLFTAVIVIMAQISIPMPAGVPLTMQTFALTLAAVVLGAKLSTLSTLIYLLLGAVGVPVFAGFTGGLAKFMGPTSGFLISFPLMVFLIGFGYDHRKMFKGAYVVFLIAGTLVNYAVGVWVYVLLTGNPVMVGITACVIPFIPTAIIKAVLASVLGFTIRKYLKNLY